MENRHEERVWDRPEAGVKLAWKILSQHMQDPVVVGIPHGGVVVAASVAEVLNLPLEVMPCRKVKGSGDNSPVIGSVCENASVFHNEYRDAPQSLAYYQTIRLRNEIEFENRFYYGDSLSRDYRYKTVIIVDDILTSPDSILACIEGIRKHKPLKVIVAVPFVEAEAARIISAMSDEFIFLKMQAHNLSSNDFYETFEPVDEWKVRQLLQDSKHLPQLRPLNQLSGLTEAMS